MTSNRSLLTSLTPSSVKAVQVANRTSMPITGIGNASISPTLFMSSVLLAPDRSGEITGKYHMTNLSDKSHYTSTQAASSSPGLRKGTFGTPMGIKIKKKMKYYTLL